MSMNLCYFPDFSLIYLCEHVDIFIQSEDLRVETNSLFCNTNITLHNVGK